MNISFTGHRPNKLPGGYDACAYYLAIPIHNVIRDLHNKHGIEKVYCGMALGFDQAVAEMCVNMRVKVVACVPCNNYEVKWPSYSQEKYQQLLADIESQGGEIRVLQDKYSPQCLQLRNIYMVDNADIVIACWDGTTGGTANCIKYAESKGKEVINIWDELQKEAKRHDG